MRREGQTVLSGQWRLVLAITFVVWISSLYAAMWYVNQSDPSIGGESNQEWLVQEGDIVEFEFSVIANGSAHTLVDRILLEYNYNELEQDAWGYRILRVRATDVPTEINVTSIAEQVVSLSGPVQIEQELNGAWEARRDIVLPFFTPIGLWSNLTDEFRSLLPVGASVDHTRSWVGEHIYTLRWVSGGFWYYVMHVWEESDGVLQATTVNVTSSDGETDLFEIHLSGQQMSYETERLQIDNASIRNAVVGLLISVGVVSFPFVGGYALLRGRHASKAEAEEPHFRYQEKYYEISSILDRWDDIERTYRLLWVGANVFCFVLGHGTFALLLRISETATDAFPIYVVIVGGISLGGAIVVVLYRYMARLTRLCSEEITHVFASEVPLISFLLGFASFLLVPLASSVLTVPTVAGRMIMLSLLVLFVFITVVAYVVMRPSKSLGVTRRALDRELEQIQKHMKQNGEM